MADLIINSWNVKGLNNPTIRAKKLLVLKKSKVHVAFLQETFLSEIQHLSLQKDWVGQVFSSSYKSHSRGTAIVINKNTPFKLEKKIIDSNGRYVLISGSINGTSITFLNVYAPNTDDPAFMSDMILTFNENCKGLGVIGGDFNCALNQKLDKSTQTKSNKPKTLKVLQGLCVESGLVDVWRELNPKVKDYTYFSNASATYSRIDYFFIYSKYLHMVKSCDISPITLSDHARITLTVQLNKEKNTFKQWRFNNSLLSDETFRSNMKMWIKNYIDENCNSNIDPNTIWEAAKATLRGNIISYTSFRKREDIAQKKELEKEIERCEKLHKSAPTEHNRNQLITARAKLNLKITNEIMQKMYFVKQNHYEFGNKPSKLLAHQLKKEQAERTIKAIRSKGNTTYCPKEINQSFQEYYKKLYKSQSKYTQDELDHYLENIKTPILSESDQQNLNAPFTEQEILAVINSIPDNKSPGPDGFSVRLYKEFWNDLKPIFMSMINNFEHSKVLPQTMCLANITVIHKSGKDPLECSSYRPISLLDQDYKIIAKALANRLDAIMPKVINPDQAGFIKGRYATDNIRRLVDITNYLNISRRPSLLLSLDAEKAFDRVEWNFLFRVLQKLNMGDNFIQWIRAIYQSPKAAVITNGFTSPPFNLMRGTRQGCPLSSSLFAIVIEILATSVRENSNIKGVHIGEDNHKLSLYADDVVLYIEQPENSLPYLYNAIELFGKFSGYKINYNKSIACPLHMNLTEEIQKLYPFKWSADGFKYLGIQFTPCLVNLFKNNYIPLINNIKSDLGKWAKLPLSLLGRINVIRMNILPRLNFLFQNIPCYLSVTFFKKLNSHVSKFIWSNKKPRIKILTLMKPESMGGLNLPNFQHYYWSAQLRNIQSWSLARRDSHWVQIEAKYVDPIPLNSLIFIKHFKKLKNMGQYFTVVNTLSAWRDCSRKLGINKHISIYSPIYQNPDLKKYLHPSDGWRHLGIIQLVHMFHKNWKLKTFQELREEFNLPNSDFLKYMQIQSILRSLKKEDKLHLELTELEKNLTTPSTIKGQISKLYNILNQENQTVFPILLKIWETDLATKFDEDTWQNICDRVFFPFTSNKIKETNFKFIHKLYLTPIKMHKISKENSPNCQRCKIKEGTFLHMFWSCEKINNFWKAIHSFTKAVLELEFEMIPCVYLLNVINNYHLDQKKCRLLIAISYFAKKCILLWWKNELAPTFSLFIEQISQFLPLEKLTLQNHNKEDLFHDLWHPLFSHLENFES